MKTTSSTPGLDRAISGAPSRVHIADGRRVVWSNGRQNIAKLDYETLEVLADHEIVGGEGRTPIAELEDEPRWPRRKGRARRRLNMPSACPCGS